MDQSTYNRAVNLLSNLPNLGEQSNTCKILVECVDVHVHRREKWQAFQTLVCQCVLAST